MLVLRDLYLGIAATWRLISTCNRRSGSTDADEEGGSGRPSAFLDSDQTKVVVDAFPGEASLLPFRA